MERQRLDKLLASTGRWSRREVKLLVRQGRVLVDGRAVSSAEEKYDPAAAAVTVDGQPVEYRPVVWVMMNKPAGLLSATEDSRARTVLDLLTPELRRRGLFPVGRLDKDTEGLLLLTDDGPLAHELLSPRHHVDKRYFVRVRGTLTEADAAAFRAGLVLEDGLRCLPAELERTAADEGIVTLREGKFHQIKRMLAQRGKPVIYLRRVSMGPLPLDVGLSLGEYRYLTEEELRALREAGSGSTPNSNV